jgi:signal transduction histidine kinase
MMPLPYPRTIRQMLLLLLLVVLVPVLLTQAALYYRRFEVRRAEELRVNLELAQAVAIAFEAYIQDILRQELLLGHALTNAPGLSVEQAAPMLLAAVRQSPAAREYSWLDPRGRVLASSNHQATGLDLGEQPWVRAIGRGQSWVVSDVYEAPPGGEAVFAVVHGIYGPGGALRGIILATVDAGRLGTAIPSISHGGEPAIIVLDRQGGIVYRYPPADFSSEQRYALAGVPLVLQALRGEPTWGTLGRTLDGQEQAIVGFAPIRSIGWVAAVMRPEAQALAPIRRDLVRDAGMLLLSMLAAILAAMAVGHRLTAPLERLRTHALAVGSGELQRRVTVDGPEELQELAAAFNRMAMEIRVRELQREEYIHTISHDLRSPLTVVSGHVQRLVQILGERADAQVQQSIQAILRGTRRMAVLTQNLVDAARLEGGTLNLCLQPVDLPAFVRDLAGQLTSLDEVVRIAIEAPPHLPRVLADPGHLERILTNLLLNALKYSPPDSPVTVRLQHCDGEVCISVQDRGPGIPADELPSLFERYRRGTQATSQGEGLGLGLYIAKSLVEAHGGRIWVESAPGSGSTFSFTLRVCAEDTPNE